MKVEDSKELSRLTNCALCPNMCKYSCPTYLATGNETITPQKIARLILYEEKGLIDDKTGFFDIMFSSAMCGACRQHCIYDDYDLRKFIFQGRSKAFKSGMLPADTTKRLETFKMYGNPHGERQLIDRGSGDLGYFVSCSAYKDQKVPQAMDRIVSAGKSQVHEFGGADICCGAPLYYAGDIEGFKKTAVRMAGEIEKRNVKKVIVDCPNCMKMMTIVYHEFGVSLDVDVIHTTQFLDALFAEDRIRVKPANGNVTFHDPCILVNDLGITAEPREILRMLGFEIREPVYSQKDTHCCGGPAGGRIADGKLAARVSSRRIDELKETGAGVYVSACSTCKAVLEDIAIRDIVELVSEQLVDE